MEIKVSTRDLTPGMYVSRLDRPWLETPFLLQGFYISNDEDIGLLQRYCAHVFVDVERDPPGAQPKAAKRHGRTNSHGRRDGAGEPAASHADLPKRVAHYSDASAVEEELEVARGLRDEVSELVAEVMESVRSGKKLDVDRAKVAVGRMTESILRNPDAFMWLRLLKDRDSYTYAHCLDASALAIAFGRHLGLSRSNLEDLGMGALMFDVGKMRLPAELLTKPSALTEAEFEVVKRHVQHSIDIMQDTRGVSAEAIAIAATHHERFDGSGYPRGLSGPEIPLLGRIAAIVDCYDAMTSERLYCPAMSAHEAIKRLYAARDTLFQDELVEQFIQTLGVYPVGSIVELSTGQVGIVIAQNRLRRLRPRVMLVLDEHKQPYGAGPIVDLVKESEDARGRALDIRKVLEPGHYGIDATEYYL